MMMASMSFAPRILFRQWIECSKEVAKTLLFCCTASKVIILGCRHSGTSNGNNHNLCGNASASYWDDIDDELQATLGTCLVSYTFHPDVCCKRYQCLGTNSNNNHPVTSTGNHVDPVNRDTCVVGPTSGNVVDVVDQQPVNDTARDGTDQPSPTLASCGVKEQPQPQPQPQQPHVEHPHQPRQVQFFAVDQAQLTQKLSICKKKCKFTVTLTFLDASAECEEARLRISFQNDVTGETAPDEYIPLLDPNGIHRFLARLGRLPQLSELSTCEMPASFWRHIVCRASLATGSSLNGDESMSLAIGTKTMECVSRSNSGECTAQCLDKHKVQGNKGNNRDGHSNTNASTNSSSTTKAKGGGGHNHSVIINNTHPDKKTVMVSAAAHRFLVCTSKPAAVPACDRVLIGLPHDQTTPIPPTQSTSTSLPMLVQYVIDGACTLQYYYFFPTHHVPIQPAASPS